MNTKILKNESDYNKALKRADEVFDAKKGTSMGDELELLLLIIRDYEDKHHQIPLPDPIEAVKSKMLERGLRAKDLIQFIGSKSYVSQVLRRKKPMTARMMRMFHKNLGIPAEILLR